MPRWCSFSERIAVLAREEMKEQEVKDEEIAEVLDRINKRIVELARQFTREVLLNHGRMTEAEIDALMGEKGLPRF